MNELTVSNQFYIYSTVHFAKIQNIEDKRLTVTLLAKWSQTFVSDNILSSRPLKTWHAYNVSLYSCIHVFFCVEH